MITEWSGSFGGTFSILEIRTLSIPELSPIGTENLYLNSDKKTFSSLLYSFSLS